MEYSPEYLDELRRDFQRTRVPHGALRFGELEMRPLPREAQVPTVLKQDDDSTYCQQY